MADIIDTIEHKDYRYEDGRLLTQPPCLKCQLWKPEKIYKEVSGQVGVQYSGHRYCWADNQYNDFSCFKSSDSKS